MIELYIILIFMIIGSLAAIMLQGLLSSVISLGAVGLALSVAFLILQAPDLAIAQLVVEIIVVVILIRATVRRDDTTLVGTKEWIPGIIGVVFSVVFLFVAYLAIKELPSFGDPIMRVSENYLIKGLQATGAANLVTAVLLDFRAFDTLGEATILFCAVIGVLAVVRRVGRKKINEKIDEEL
ncbi:MAG: hydrogen gas-evolving membrane-bound hydrogenase subunit E [bacterium]